MTPDGYNFVSVPRPHGRGGGVGIILDNDVSHKITSSTSDGHFKQFEHIQCEIGQCGKCTVLLCVVYRPQPSKKKGPSVPQFMGEFEAFLKLANTIAHDLILVGDLNFHLDNVNDAEALGFLPLLEAYNLTQHINSPTHIKGHMLDVVVIRKSQTYRLFPK